MVRRIGFFVGVAVLTSGAGAAAQSADVVVPGGGGQQALAVRAGSEGVVAKVCAGASGCSAAGGKVVEVPDDVRPLLGRARTTTVTLVGGKRVARIDVDGNQAGTRYVLLVAAPLAGKPAEPLVLHRGWTGSARGEHGEERTGVVIQDAERGGERLFVGERREDVSICGRPTLVGVKRVDPTTLSLERVPWPDNLGRAERDRAPRLSATRATGPAPETARLLRATAASSAVERKFASLTDGDSSTTWIENDKTGPGRGEFVTMSADTEVPITGFDFVVRPTGDANAEGAAPKRMYLATRDRLFEVTLPVDAWKEEAGARWEVKLPEEIRTSCVALVLDEAHAPAGKAARVTIAEIVARTPFDGSSPTALAGALAGGGARAEGAAAMLARAGKPGVEAAAAAYEKLDDAGKRLAMRVVESGSCDEQVPFFVGRVLAGAPAALRSRPRERDRGDSDSSELDHARERLRRCGRAAAPALADLVAKGPEPVRAIAAAELSLVAPGYSVPVLTDALGGAGDDVRRELRTALAFAAKSERATEALEAELAAERWDRRDDKTKVDLLRALGPAAPRIRGAAARIHALATPRADFRTRFLLLPVAAGLAAAGDEEALRFLRASLRSDADHHVRARAAEVAAGVAALGPDLAAAAEDREPRVREASVAALARVRGPAARAAIAAAVRRLRTDEWTFVRTGAARSLEALPADPAADAALADALRDPASDVRVAALDALGAHRAVAHRQAVRDRAEDREETLDVRAHAVLALGAMCDAESADLFTKLARRAKNPLDERDRRLGAAAIEALGRLHPRDLRERLAPLLEKDAFVGARELAKDALASPGSCR